MKKNIFMLALALAFATAGLMAQTPQTPQKKEAVKTAAQVVLRFVAGVKY